VLGTYAVDDFLNSWNIQVCVERGIVDIPWGVNRSQYFYLASLYDSYVRLGSTAPQFEAIGPYGGDYGFNVVGGWSKALLMKLEWGQQLLLVMQQKVENVTLVFVWVRAS
jgi:hypothetical protein